MSTDPDGEQWLPLAEAAAHLGLSRHQLRRRVRAGQIASRQVATPHGPAYEVRVDADATVASTLRQGGEHNVTVTPPLTELIQLVRDLQTDVVAKAEAAAMWQTRAELLSMQLQQAQERILALEAPREPTPIEMTTGGSTGGLSVEPSHPPTAQKRPWWRFWKA